MASVGTPVLAPAMHERGVRYPYGIVGLPVIPGGGRRRGTGHPLLSGHDILPLARCHRNRGGPIKAEKGAP